VFDCAFAVKMAAPKIIKVIVLNLIKVLIFKCFDFISVNFFPLGNKTKLQQTLGVANDKAH